jgi:hypothetical protein
MQDLDPGPLVITLPIHQSCSIPILFRHTLEVESFDIALIQPQSLKETEIRGPIELGHNELKVKSIVDIFIPVFVQM